MSQVFHTVLPIITVLPLSYPMLAIMQGCHNAQALVSAALCNVLPLHRKLSGWKCEWMAVTCGAGRPPNYSVPKLHLMPLLRGWEDDKRGWGFCIWADVADDEGAQLAYSMSRLERRDAIIEYSSYDALAVIRVVEHVLLHLSPSQESLDRCQSAIKVARPGEILPAQIRHYDDSGD